MSKPIGLNQGVKIYLKTNIKLSVWPQLQINITGNKLCQPNRGQP